MERVDGSGVDFLLVSPASGATLAATFQMWRAVSVSFQLLFISYRYLQVSALGWDQAMLSLVNSIWLPAYFYHLFTVISGISSFYLSFIFSYNHCRLANIQKL